ncbi:MAG: dienelactone hydrolase family protein [Parvularculaceae bacterium]|nr:dienelactone hydrolase family protein [Parvularculaceae bacterium]
MAERPSSEVIRLYDAFTHGAVERREFLDRLARLAGSTAAAAALLPVLGNDYARAGVVAEDDKRLTTRMVTFDTGAIVDLPPPEEISPGVTRPFTHIPRVSAYCAYQDTMVRPAVIVIHENRGLNPHIKDVARRLALEGFVAFAVDMLSPIGGTPTDEDRARLLIGKLDRAKTAQKLAAIAEHLAMVKTHGRHVGAVGFCWGGGMVNALAAAGGDFLEAGVVYYGRQGAPEEAARIKAAMLYHYAARDERINQGVAPWEAALSAAKVRFQSYMYENADHAFNNDTNAARYDKAAADLAWGRSVAFLREHFA